MNAPDLQQFCARSDAQSADVVEDYEMWKGGYERRKELVIIASMT